MGKVIMNTTRSGYATDQINGTMTVGELIDWLAQFDSDAKIYTAHDNGYTYGAIRYGDFEEEFEDEEE